MIPIFGYGEEIVSSAAVESSFKKLTFKHTSLPTGIGTFLENHIISIKGESLIRGAVYHPFVQHITSPERSFNNICEDGNFMDALATYYVHIIRT